MDKYDRLLLAALMENGRATFAELGRRVNLSAPPSRTGWPSWKAPG